MDIRVMRGNKWESLNPVLRKGEPGYNTTNSRLKIGDGITPWNDLTYILYDSVNEPSTLYGYAQPTLLGPDLSMLFTELEPELDLGNLFEYDPLTGHIEVTRPALVNIHVSVSFTEVTSGNDGLLKFKRTGASVFGDEVSFVIPAGIPAGRYQSFAATYLCMNSATLRVEWEANTEVAGLDYCSLNAVSTS